MKNFFKFLVVALGTAVGTGSNFLIQVYLANKLSIDEFGFFTSLFNIVNLLSPIVAFGITGYLLKCYSEEGLNARKWFKLISIFNVLTIFISYFLFNLFFLEENNKILISMFFVYMISISLNNFTLLKYQVAGLFFKYAFWLALPNLFRLILVFLFINLLGVNVLGVGLLFFIASLFVLLYSIYSMYLMHKGKFSIRYTDNKIIHEDLSLKKLFINSYPYGLSGLLYLIYYQIDILILKYYVSYSDIALYGVSLIYVSAICLLPTIFYQQVCMPKIHYWALNNKNDLKNFYSRNVIISIFVGVFLYGLINLCMPYLLSFTFKEKYNEILDFFYILSLIIPIKFVSQSAGAVMSTNIWIKSKVKIMSFAALLNLVLNLILIPYIGLYGAISCKIVTELFLMISFIVYLKFKFGK